MDFKLLQTRLLNEVRARVRNGEMTERGLARFTGISQPHIHNALKGSRFLSLDATDRILRRLGVDLTDLLAAELGTRRDPVGPHCRMVALLDGLIGPEHPFPQTVGHHRYPFPAADVNRLPDPVAARLAPQANGAPLFAGDAVLLLDRSAGLLFDPAEEGYYALDLLGSSAIGLARAGHGICLWNPKGEWEPAGPTGREAADLIRARVRLVVRRL